jgi:hypothetical protein
MNPRPLLGPCGLPYFDNLFLGSGVARFRGRRFNLQVGIENRAGKAPEQAQAGIPG